MSDEDKSGSAADDKAGGDVTKDQNDQGASGTDGSKTVAYDTYKKTVTEAKAAKAKLKELEDKLANAENDKLGAEGKKDELIAKLRGDLDKATKSQKDTLNSFVYSSLDSQVRAEAERLGCVDADAVSKLVDLSDVEVDTKTFKADKEKLTEVLEDLKKSKPYLFNKAGPKINTKMPGGKFVVDGSKTKKLSELTKDEIWAQLRALENVKQ